MIKFQTINATKARNNFFSLLKESYLKKKTFLVEKSDIPMVYIVPVTHKTGETIQLLKRDKQFKAIQRAKRLRKNMKQTTDSVTLLRQIRKYGK